MNFKSGLFLKGLVIGALCLIIFLFAIRQAGIKLPFISRDTQAMAAKKKAWEDMEKKVASWGDALGMGIDPKIKKAVIVLNLLGFETQQSCQGHMDWGLPYPWVSFNTITPEIQKLDSELQEVRRLIAQKEGELQKKYPTLSLGEAMRKEESPERNKLYKKTHLLYDKMEELSRSKIAQLKDLITAFYKKHHIDLDNELYIDDKVFPSYRLHSLGGDWQVIRTKDEQMKKLEAYQKEMDAFVDFLTNYYYSAEKFRSETKHLTSGSANY